MTNEAVLERTVLICAPRAVVFRYFTDSERFAAWWGAGSTVDARPGGAVRIRYPNGITASGSVVEMTADERFVFTYGYDSHTPIGPGASRIVVTLEDRPGGTLVYLRHELPDEATRDAHVPGWRYQLAVFANVVAQAQHGGVDQAIDRYFSLWSEGDAAARDQGLGEVATADFTFQDAFSCTAGLTDFSAHLTATRAHMPGLALRRNGEVHQCQGTAVVDWIAEKSDGAVAGRGTNVFQLAPDGRLRAAVGLWRR